MTTDAPFYDLVMPPQTIGRLKAFQGNFGMHVRAYAYIRSYGSDLTRGFPPCGAQRQLRPRPTARHLPDAL